MNNAEIELYRAECRSARAILEQRRKKRELERLDELQDIVAINPRSEWQIMSYSELKKIIEKSESAESIVDLEVKISRIYKAGNISFSHYMRLENLCVARKLEFICLSPARSTSGDSAELQAAFDGATA